jgi:hypothetical protein
MAFLLPKSLDFVPLMAISYAADAEPLATPWSDSGFAMK